ncbi:proline dipeptidase [uncultured archaeon]|nr:proline dipeptidase [uncultured archaeon]HKJ96845.1 Xaa-Pro peptidase family protein [Thermoplasmataceae archaeon]
MSYENLFTFAREAETILILNGGGNSIDKNFFYLTGAESGSFEGSAVIATKDDLKIITSSLEEEVARDTGHEVVVYDSRNGMRDILKEEFKDVNTVGLNYSSLTMDLYKELLRIIPDKEFIDVSSSISEARKIKSEEELKKLREAAKIGSEILPTILDRFREGITEAQVAAEMAYEMMKAGASEPSFSTIVAFGANSSMPHYSPHDVKLKKGDFVLMDYGALYKRYCSDITRTVVFGRASQEQKDMYEVVRNAQEESMKEIKDGANGKDLDGIASKIIDDTKYKGRFIHSLGHGLGMDVHDHPALGRNLDFILKTNMVVTVEPGVYIPKFGGVRIEDDVIVKKNGFEKITSAPTYDLIEVS